MIFYYFRVPPSYVYPSPYLAAPGGIVPLPPAASLSHASALASQFYEYQNLNAAAAASLATYPGSAAYPVDPYPYTSAAAAGRCTGVWRLFPPHSRFNKNTEIRKRNNFFLCTQEQPPDT